MVHFQQSDAANFDKLVGAEALDCLVQDPPAGVRFMGRAWDGDHGGRDSWVKLHAGLFAAGRRACKPGAWALTWALPRTSHWTACALDDAGWEITDVITHIQGQGWPKNAKTCLKPASEHWLLARNGGGGALQIDASRVARGGGVYGSGAWDGRGNEGNQSGQGRTRGDGAGVVAEAHPAGSWPTNLVLSHCPECVEQGTREVRGSNAPGMDRGMAFGRMNDDAWAATERMPTSFAATTGLETVQAFECLAGCSCGLTALSTLGGQPPRCACGEAMGWACPVAELDSKSGTTASGASAAGRRTGLGYGGARGDGGPAISASKGGASRFFPIFHYAAKCPSSERHAGAESLLWRRDDSVAFGFRRVDRATFETLHERERAEGNVHPTVKGLKLAEWLVGLVCPPGGKGGDPFCGSGSIPIAAMRRGFDWIGADLSPDAIDIARARLMHWQALATKSQKAFTF